MRGSGSRITAAPLSGHGIAGKIEVAMPSPRRGDAEAVSGGLFSIPGESLEISRWGDSSEGALATSVLVRTAPAPALRVRACINSTEQRGGFGQ